MRTVSFPDSFFKQLSCFKKLQLLLGDGHYSQRKEEEEITDMDKNKNKSGGGEGEAKQKQIDDQQSQ